MPYAKGQTLSQKLIEGGIQITQAEYDQGREDKLAGKLVAVKDGKLQTFTEKTRTVYATTDRSPLTLSAEEDTPTGYTDQVPPGRWYVWDDAAWEHDAEGELADWRESASVSAFQAYQALDDQGYMQKIEDHMALETTSTKTRRAWNTAQEFRRMSPTVMEIAGTLGLTDAQVDDLFEYASTIEA